MRYKGENNEVWRFKSEQLFKNLRSSDCKLEFIYMKSESLVIVNQHVTVNHWSNFAHTAHHARRVALAGNLISMYLRKIKINFRILIFDVVDKLGYFNTLLLLQIFEISFSKVLSCYLKGFCFCLMVKIIMLVGKGWCGNLGEVDTR